MRQNRIYEGEKAFHLNLRAIWHLKRRPAVIGFDCRRASTRTVNKLEIHFCEVETAISVMREIAVGGRERGNIVWPDEWLTKEEVYVKPQHRRNGIARAVIAYAEEYCKSRYPPHKFELLTGRITMTPRLYMQS